MVPLLIEQYPQKHEIRGVHENGKYDVTQWHRVLCFSPRVENSDYPKITYFDLCTSSALEGLYIGRLALCNPLCMHHYPKPPKHEIWLWPKNRKRESHEVTFVFSLFQKWKCEIGPLPKSELLMDPSCGYCHKHSNCIPLNTIKQWYTRMRVYHCLCITPKTTKNAKTGCAPKTENRKTESAHAHFLFSLSKTEFRNRPPPTRTSSGEAPYGSSGWLSTIYQVETRPK